MPQKKKAPTNKEELSRARMELAAARERNEPEALRAVLARYPQHSAALIELSLSLTATELPGPTDTGPELDALVDRARHRAFATVFPMAQATSLKALRQARRLTLTAAAGQLRLGVDVLSALESGRIRAQSVPQRLLGALGQMLDQSAAQIGAVLGAQGALAPAYQRSRSGNRKGVQAPTEMEFAEAVRLSAQMSAEAKAEWLGE
ncbi:MAG TPA: hypothetical protein VF807_13615 [Ktedonobacterales bacterium]